MRYYFILLSFLVCVSLNSQIIWSSLTTKNMNKCTGQDTFRIRVQNNTGGVLNNVSIRPSLPSGISVLSNNSIIDSTVVYPGGNGGITWNGTDFIIGNSMPNLAILDFYYIVRANCSVSSTNLSNTYSLRSNGVQINLTGTSDAYTVRSAVLSITSIDSTVIFNKNIGYAFTQKLKITNGGQGLLDSFNINLATAAVKISMIQVTGSNTIATFRYDSINGILTLFPTVTFSQNQTIEISTLVTISKCTPTSRVLTAYWGCGGSTCQTSTAVNSDFTINNTHNVSISSRLLSPNTNCFVGQTKTYEINVVNSGNTNIRLRQVFFVTNNDGQGGIFNSGFNTNTDNIDLGNVFVTPPLSSGISPYLATSNYIRANGIYNPLPIGGVLPCNAGTASSAFLHWGLAANPTNDTTLLLLPGDTLKIRFDRKFCDNSQNNCSTPTGNPSSYNYYYNARLAAQANYFDQCGTQQSKFQTLGSHGGYYYLGNFFNKIELPAQVIGADTFSYTGNFRLNANSEVASSRKIFKIEIEVPIGVNYITNSYSAINIYNLKTLQFLPTSSGGKLLIEYNVPSNWTTIDPFFKLNFISNGQTCGRNTIKTTLTSYVDSLCMNVSSIICQIDSIDFECPVNCYSTFPIKSSFERINFGLPDNDNDNFPDSSNAVVDKTKASLNYLRGGDTIKSYSKNVIYADSVNGIFNWNLVQVDQKFDTGIWKTASIPQITLKRGPNTYVINGTHIVLGSKNRDFLITWGNNLPAGWNNYQHGDTIIIEQQYVFNMNSNNPLIANQIIPTVFYSTVYTSNGTPTNLSYIYNGSSNKKTCLTSKFNINLVGHDNFIVIDNIGFANGCTNNLSYGLEAVASRFNRWNFPFEYRHTFYPNTIEFDIPNGFSFVRTSGWSTATKIPASLQQVDSFRSFNGNKVIYNMKEIRRLTGSIYPNEFGGGSITIEIKPNSFCSSGKDYNAVRTANWCFFDFSVGKNTDSIVRTSGSIIRTNSSYPSISASAIPNNQSPSSGKATYKLDIKNNTSTSTTPKAWINLKKMTENVTISNVRFNGNHMTPDTNGYYVLRALNSSETISVFFDLDITSCASAPVKIYYGLECNAPLHPIESITCKDSTTVSINPVNGNVQATINPLNNGVVYNFCNTFDVELLYSSSLLGNVKKASIDVVLPKGLEYIPNSVMFKYPANNTNFTSSSYNPMLSNNVLHFDITKNGNLGILNDSILTGVYDTTKNTVRIKYTVKSFCGINEGDVLQHTFNSTQSCGDTIPSFKINSTSINFANLIGPSYVTDPSRSKIDTIKSCNGENFYVNILNLGATSTQSIDSIKIKLPNTVKYLSYINSGVNTKNAPTFSPSISNNPDSSSTLSWPMLGGVVKDDSIKFILKLIPSNNYKVYPKSSAIVLTGRSISVSCGQDSCKIFKTNVNGYYDIPIHILPKPSIGSFSGDTVICKNENTILSNTVSGGKWYASNSNKLNVDSVVGLVKPLDTGSHFVKYIITNALNCTNSDSLRIKVDSLPFVGTIQGVNRLCPNDSATLSIATSGGVWSVTDTNIVVIKQNGKIYSKNSGNTIIKYVGPKNSRGCNDSITMLFIVDSIPMLTITPPSAVCSPSTIDLTSNAITFGSKANGGSLTYSYWMDSSANTSLVSPITANAIQDSGRYYIKATNSSGCSINSSVLVTINTKPNTAINKTSTTAICETSTKTLSGLPAGGSWSVVSGGGSISGTTYTPANISSNTNVTVRYTIAGNGACPATTSDSSFVVNFQDTAINKTASSAICETNTKTLSGLPTGGTWSIISGGGAISGTTYSPANVSSNTNVTVRYTIAGNGACPATTSDSTFVVNFQDTAVNKTTTTAICETSTKTLSGLPAGGTWSLVSGRGSISGTTYTPANISSNTNVTVRYTIAGNGACPATTSDSSFVVNFQDTAVNKTATSAICETNTKTLSGLPAGGTWSVVSGGGSISGTTYTPANISSNTNVTVRYTIAGNGACPATTSDSTFVVNFQDTAVNKTTTTAICETNTKTLSGLPVGGTWSLVSGGGSISGTNYTPTNISTNTNVTVRYTIAGNGACPATTSDSTFVVNFQDTAVNKTSTIAICETSTKTLSGLPAGGTWSVVSGDGFISGTTYTPTNISTNTNVTVRYTIAGNGACPATTSDSTFVVNFQDTAVNKTSITPICETSTKTLSGLPAGGTWSVVSGGGSISGTTYTPANISSNTNVTVRYTIAGNGACPATTSDSTFVVNFQDTAVNKTTTTAICETNTKTLSGLPAGGTWSVVSGGGSISGTTYTPTNISTNTNVTVRYTIAGNGACPATTSDSSFVVNITPEDLQFEIINQTCLNLKGAIILKNREPNVTYSIDNINFFNKDTFENLYAGIYNIYAKSNSNCIKTMNQTAKIDTIIRINASMSKIKGDSIVRKGTTVIYQIESIPNALTYTWILPNGWIGSSTTNIISVVIGDSSGVVSVVANSLNCSSNQLTKSIKVLINKLDTIYSQSYMDSIKKIHIDGLRRFLINKDTIYFSNNKAPKNGTIDLNNIDSNGNISYKPNKGFIGVDSCVITYCDNNLCETIVIYFLVYPNFDPKNLIYTNYNVTLIQNGENNIPVISSANKTYYKLNQDFIHGTIQLDTSNGNFIYSRINQYCGDDSAEISIVYEFDYPSPKTLVYKYWIKIINLCDFEIPNYISPNGDGKNDKFIIPQKFRNKFPNLKLIIYNRWGNIVWRSKGVYNDDFNGTNQFGDILPDGVYYYILELEDNFKIHKTSFIQIYRD